MRTKCSALLLVLSLLTPMWSAEIYVDDDGPGDPLPFDRQISDPAEDGSADHPFDSVQEAIDAAVDGDTIIVAAGHYLSPDPWIYDEINFKGKNVRLVSSAPTDFSVAERTLLCGVIIFQGDEDANCLLQGFKIQNHGHGGILGHDTHATISHCIISGNGPCGATVVKDVHGRIANCLIVDNTTFHDCGVMPVVSGCLEVVNCTIANNLSGVVLSNIGLPAGDRVKIRNCIIYGNQDYQLHYSWNHSEETTGEIKYCLVPTSNDMSPRFLGSIEYLGIQYGDPCFVRLGSWEDTPTGRTRGNVSVASAGEFLVEGDYHLKSEGWRWSEQRAHGSHWYYDTVTSPGVDAGDPLDSLGEEPERAPGDPEGYWGFNHAIDLGAYGGTVQASMSPTRGVAPGIGAVDLRDYWPFTVGNRWWVHNREGTTHQFRVTSQSYAIYNERSPVSYWTLETTNAPNWAAKLYLLYFDRVLYATEAAASMNQLPQIPEQFRALFPMYPVEGSTVSIPCNPFVQGTPEYRSAVVARGMLEEVLAGTDTDPNQLLAGSWHDVIALREENADGTPGQPITIFARGFGPLMLAGQPVEQADLTQPGWR